DLTAADNLPHAASSTSTRPQGSSPDVSDTTASDWGRTDGGVGALQSALPLTSAPSSAASSPAVWYRHTGFFANSLCTTFATASGTSGRCVCTDVGASELWRTIFSSAVPPGNGTSPVSR